MAYEQAQIPVQKTEEFEHLQAAIERVFRAAEVARFLRRLEAKNVQVRGLEKILKLGLLEESDAVLAASGKRGEQLYQALTVSDQALMREFYLERVEQVDAKVRQKYNKVYRYY
jgi:hypothetical protein